MQQTNAIVFYNVNIHCETEVIDGYIRTNNKTIMEIGEGDPHLGAGEYAIDGNGHHIIPGFIDVHIHGTAGADVMNGEEAALRTIAASLPAEGTTSFLATTITQSKEAIDQALKTVANYRIKYQEAELLGIHLEGPFINIEKAGAQPSEYVIPPSIEQFKHWQHVSNGRIKVITLAPEMDIQEDFISFLVHSGVIVSAGHTNASMAEIRHSVKKGVSQLTHLCNAMTAIHHRDVGAVGAGLLLKELMCELIVDGLHVSPDMVNLIYQQVGPDRLILITDSVEAKGMPPGTYSLGGQIVTTDGKKALLSNGTLAGSVLKMIDAAKNIQKMTTATIGDIVKMTAINPAKQLGLYDRKGSISEGKDADFLLVDEHFNLMYTICRGSISYKREEH